MDQTPSQYHSAVMVAEVVELMRPLEAGTIVDATFGGGGHSMALLEAMPEIDVLALDRDPDAASTVPLHPRLRFVAANFKDLDRVLTRSIAGGASQHDDDSNADPATAVAGVLFDLGVSSHQLDEPDRGFSYRRGGPLDMRMGPDAELSADDIVNGWDRTRLSDIIRRYGEEEYAGRIAGAIVAARPIPDTGRLADVVAGAVPAAARRRRHPARKTFQAIRIAVNEELSNLESGLEAAIRWVRPGGRVVVIAYHSLEDRIVKRRFAAGSAGCDCPPNLPVCTCGRATELRSLARKVIRPGEDEVVANPRARSARLRAVEKVAE